MSTKPENESDLPPGDSPWKLPYVAQATQLPDPAVWAWEPSDPLKPPPPVDPSFFDWIPCMCMDIFEVATMGANWLRGPAAEFDRGIAELSATVADNCAKPPERSHHEY